MLIGIVGKLRSGKDTSADYLIRTKGFTKYSFARPLKAAAMEIFGFTEEQMHTDLKDVIDEEWGFTPRRALQVLGTELLQFEIQKHLPEFAEIGRFIWVKRFKQWYRRNHMIKNVVIADVRFQHEVDAIINMGGVVWRVDRPSLVSTDGHSSEMELENMQGISQTLVNDATLADLYNKIDALVPNEESLN
jgi:hypothetical protein